MDKALQPLLIRAYGFDERGKETLRLTFKGPGRNCARLVEQGLFDAAIFNLDNLNTATELHKFRLQQPQAPVIVIGMKDPGLKGITFLEKPVSVSDVVGAVRSLCADRSATPALAGIELVPPHSKPAPTPRRTTNSRNIYFNPAEFAQAMLVEATEKAQKSCSAVRVSFKHHGAAREWITFVPEVECVVTDMKAPQLRKLCCTPLSMVDYDMETLGLAQTSEMINRINESGAAQVGFEDFLWRSGLWVSGGLLPRDTDLETPVTLSHWPNMTRLGRLPNAIRITALLINRPTPLPMVAKVLKLPPAHVYAFYNAAAALGIVEQGGAVISTSVRPHSQRGLLSRILGRLRRA